MSEYVHGYSERELQRLREQSLILEELLHSGTAYPAGSRVLEAGCGVGAQTAILARRSPGAQFVSVDVSEESLIRAEDYVLRQGIANVTFLEADITKEPFGMNSVDHVFVCFVLEHLSDPAGALSYIKKILKPGGTVTLIEGDHGACVWTPETEASRAAWNGLVRSQQALGHDPRIGRRLYPLLHAAKFDIEYVEPRPIYADGKDPELLDGVVNKIIVPMTKTAKDAAIAQGCVDEATFDKGVADLEKTGVPPGGSFFYSWFKGVGVKTG